MVGVVLPPYKGSHVNLHRKALKSAAFSLCPPKNFEVLELAEVLAKRTAALLKRRGVDAQAGDAEESDRLARNQPWLSEVNRVPYIE
jgi:hypothetical protein